MKLSHKPSRASRTQYEYWAFKDCSISSDCGSIVFVLVTVFFACIKVTNSQSHMVSLQLRGLNCANPQVAEIENSNVKRLVRSGWSKENTTNQSIRWRHEIITTNDPLTLDFKKWVSRSNAEWIREPTRDHKKMECPRFFQSNVCLWVVKAALICGCGWWGFALRQIEMGFSKISL